MNILYALGVAAITALVALSGFNAHPVEQNVGATIPTAVALWESSLATAITSSATSMTLTSAVDKAGTTFASSTYAFVIDSGTSQEEMVIANCTATACTGMTRGLSPITGTSTVASLQYAHRRGASVKITDGPQLLILSRILNGQETVPNPLVYDSSVSTTTLSTQDQALATVSYVNGVAIAGGADASVSTKGITKLSYAPASASNPIAVGDNDPRLPSAPHVLTYYSDTSTTTNVYAITPSPAISAYAIGQKFSFYAHATSTATTTLNVNSLGAKEIKKPGNFNIVAGDIVTGQMVNVEYDGTYFQMISANGNSSTYQYFTFATSTTWLAPRGVTSVVVDMIGGGGGGGGGDGGCGTAGNGGGGGGGGQLLLNQSVTVVPYTTYQVTIGAGGTGGATCIAGTQGATSTFATLNAGPGYGGQSASSTSTRVGGAGGTTGGTGATVGLTGGNGGDSSEAVGGTGNISGGGGGAGLVVGGNGGINAGAAATVGSTGGSGGGGAGGGYSSGADGGRGVIIIKIPTYLLI